MRKKVLFIACILTIILSVSSILAITGSLGNSRMILRANVGDTIEKYVLVKNTNNVTLNILIAPSGDLKDSVIVRDNNFSLEPNSEKKAYFTIKVTKGGTTETKLDVRFLPEGEKQGVGLSSTVIIIAGNDTTTTIDDLNGTIDDPNSKPVTNQTNVTVKPGKINTGTNESKQLKISPVVIGLIITGIIFLVFIILVIYANSKIKNNNLKNGALKGSKLNEKKNTKHK